MPREIIFIGHSNGGSIIVELGRKFLDDFKKHVTRIFLTSSNDSLKDDGSEVSNFFKSRAIDYIESGEKLGTKLSPSGAIPLVNSFSDFTLI